MQTMQTMRVLFPYIVNSVLVIHRRGCVRDKTGTPARGPLGGGVHLYSQPLIILYFCRISDV